MSDLTARDAAVFLHQSSSTPVHWDIARAEGTWIEDHAGRRWMDFHGNSAHHLGHGHPAVIAAIKAQLGTLPFAPRRFTSEPAVHLAEALSALSPIPGARVLFAPSGSDAVDMALRLARAHTGRPGTLAFTGSYHGTTLAAASAGGDATFRQVPPLVPHAHHVPQYAPPEEIEPILATGRIACLIAEPMRAWPLTAPPGYWPAIRALCTRHGTLMIFDEIPTGLGKTGRLFASEHEGATPDITVLGKALGGGILPLAALLAHPSLNTAARHEIGHVTHEKNPVTCAAGLAILRVLQDQDLPARAASLGEITLARLRDSLAGQPGVTALHGRGLMLGIELDDPARAARICAACMAEGLAFKTSNATTLTLSPPLTIAEPDLDRAIGIVTRQITAP